MVPQQVVVIAVDEESTLHPSVVKLSDNLLCKIRDAIVEGQSNSVGFGALVDSYTLGNIGRDWRRGLALLDVDGRCGGSQEQSASSAE